MTWNNRSVLLGCAVTIGALVACGTTKSPTPPPPTTSSVETKGDKSVERVDTATVQATVVAVNQKTRLVTLRGSDGEQFEIRADERVRNLPQVHKGDVVTVVYQTALAVTVRKPGEAKPGMEEVEGIERAAPGQKPAAAGGRTVQITATVTKVDRAKEEITLRGPKGKKVAIKVKDPANLEKVKKGDLLEIEYTEAIGISVDKPD